MKTREEAREYFSCDRFATENGITLDELDDSHAVTSMTLGARHRNAFGGVMGGAIFTLADFAFAALTNDRDRVTVAQQVRSKDNTYLKKLKKYKIKIITEVELGAMLTHSKLITITGTDGKTTTATLLNNILNACNHSSVTVG